MYLYIPVNLLTHFKNYFSLVIMVPRVQLHPDAALFTITVVPRQVLPLMYGTHYNHTLFKCLDIPFLRRLIPLT